MRPKARPRDGIMIDRSLSEPAGRPAPPVAPGHAGSSTRLGRLEADHHATTPAGNAAAQLPNTVRVVSLEAGVLRDLEGDPALNRAPEGRRHLRKARVWVDVGANRSRAFWPRSAASSSFIRCWPKIWPNAISEPRSTRSASCSMWSSSRSIRRRAVLRTVSSISFLGKEGPAQRPQPVVGSARDASHPRRARQALGRGPDYVLWALCDDTIDAYFRSSTASGTRSTRSRTKSSTGPTGVSLAATVRAQARPDRDSPHHGPRARDVQRSLEPRGGADLRPTTGSTSATPTTT